MVMSSSSSWVRPAQAIIHMESGEMRHFPPRNRGSLPRALTFGDQQQSIGIDTETGPININYFNTHINNTDLENNMDINQNDRLGFSVLISSESEKYQIDDPPEQYESFEHEYSNHSLIQEMKVDSQLEYDILSMSTPTQQYSNLLRTKKPTLPHEISNIHKVSTLINKSNTEETCYSPLIQNSSTETPLSLDQLVELYSRKMESARIANLTNEIKNREQMHRNLDNRLAQAEDMNENLTTLTLSSPVAHSTSPNKKHDSPPDSHQPEEFLLPSSRNFCSPLQLMTLDIHLLLQELELLFDENDKATGYSESDWICVPTEELNSLLNNCCKKNVEYVMLE